jgi:RNA polymerase sigma factor (sigma-70 family)
MNERDWLAKRFEENREHLRTVAHRMLGSPSEAEDAVQEAWLRLSRSDGLDVENLGGWLTTVVARVCLDALRSRKYLEEAQLAERQELQGKTEASPEKEVLLADSIGPALLAVLDVLAPAERVAFVLHDMFDMAFEQIAPIVGRSPAAARQLASRARRRLQGRNAVPDPELPRQREIVDAFLAASRDGKFEALLAVLDPDVVLRADPLVVKTAAAYNWGGASGLASEVHGAPAVAEAFKGRARGTQPALIDGMAGAVWAPGGTTRGVWALTFDDEKIVEIELIMDPIHLAQIEVLVEP